MGFLAGDPGRVGSVIHGLRSTGHRERPGPGRRAARHPAGTDCAGGGVRGQIRRVLLECKKFGVTAKIIPEMLEIVRGRVSLSQMRDIAIDDLLRRQPVRLDSEAIAGVIRGRRVLITGAGGSIGSKVLFHVCRFAPQELVLVEQAENSLFHIHRELSEACPGVRTIRRGGRHLRRAPHREHLPGPPAGRRVPCRGAPSTCP